MFPFIYRVAMLHHIWREIAWDAMQSILRQPLRIWENICSESVDFPCMTLRLQSQSKLVIFLHCNGLLCAVHHHKSWLLMTKSNTRAKVKRGRLMEDKLKLNLCPLSFSSSSLSSATSKHARTGNEQSIFSSWVLVLYLQQVFKLN